jgi:hypothetical protein
MSDGPMYVVRGARLRCECGTHERRLNLPESHGSYVCGRPMMNEDDHSPENVAFFGICTNPQNPSGETIYLIGENGETLTGKPCLPVLPEPWLLTKSSTLVDGKPALTTDSFLVCSYRSCIRPQSSGQEGD